MLPKQNRLLSPNDFKKIYKYGFRARGKYGMLIGLLASRNGVGGSFSSTNNSLSRFGFIISAKIGKANKRNLLKRRLRAVAHELLNTGILNEKQIDFSYISFTGCDDFDELKKEFTWQVDKVIRTLK